MVEDVCRRYSEGFCNGCDYCVLYSSEDYQDVSHVKQCIRDSGYSVYDHNEDGLLGRYKLDNMTAGVLKCKNAIIFLSTSFIASQRHKYEMKFTLQSKDTNSILVLKLGECTTPECIRCFGLYVIPLERKQISSKMVLKALTDPKSVLAQSSSDKNLTFGQLLMNWVKSNSGYTMCPNGKCEFMCSGNEHCRFDMHLRECVYFPVRCSYRPCKQVCERRDLDYHQEKCSYRPSTCKHSDCGASFPKNILYKHEKKCKKRLIRCKNWPMGCHETVPIDSQGTHHKACIYNWHMCETCGLKVMNRDCEEHDCHEMLGIVVFFLENGWGSGDVDQRGVRKLLKGDQSNRPKLCPVCLECVPAEKFEEHMSLHPSIHSRTYTDESNIHDKTEQMLDNRRETSNYFYQKKFTSNATAVKRGRTLCRLEQMTWTDLIEVFSIAIPQDNHCRMSKSIFG